MTICPELLGRTPNSNNSRGRPRRQQVRVIFSCFENLPEEGRLLIQGWLREAEQEENPFKQFVFTWMAFNGWAECITKSNTDREYLRALMQNTRLQQAFESLKQNQAFSKLVEEFAGFWPIFKVRDLRRLRIRRWQTPIEHRERLIREYFGERGYEIRATMLAATYAEPRKTNGLGTYSRGFVSGSMQFVSWREGLVIRDGLSNRESSF